MCSRLDSCQKSNILCVNQFGFRENSNTSDAIIEFLDYVYSLLDSKQSTIAVYLDFLGNGVSGVMQRCFGSYLSNRIQYVSIKNDSSSKSKITLGVPQVSVLGPVLIFLYINDMYRSLILLRRCNSF